MRQLEEGRGQNSSNHCWESCRSDSSEILAVHEDKHNNVSTCVTNERDNEDHSGNAWSSEMNDSNQRSKYHSQNVTNMELKSEELKNNTDKNSREDYFDSLLEMIQESIKDLNV